MIIQHLEKSTLLDYPGKVAAVLFTYGCNLRCPYCHNPELVTQPKKDDLIITEEEIFAFLKKRIKVLDGLVITGGEPTCHKDLLDFIKKVKKKFPKLLIKLDTNGTFPERIKEIIDSKIVDYWAMDVKYAEELYKQGLNGGMKTNFIKQSIDYIRDSGVDFEFRTTVVRSLHNNEAMKEIGEMIKGSPIYYIQNFRSGKTIDENLDNSESFKQEELEEFKKIMEKYVKSVIIRN